MLDKCKRLFFSFLISLIYSISVNASTYYLPDGTEIRIKNDQAFYYCRGKFILLPDEAYMLSDGSLLTVKNGTITEFITIENFR